MMIQMQFYIRFSAQLRRTKPDLTKDLDDAVSRTAQAAGGKVEQGRRGLLLCFDESRIGFWLNIVIFLEKAHEIMKKAASDLYGYALVLGRDSDEVSDQSLCLSVSAAESSAEFSAQKRVAENTGIWCSPEIQEALEFYSVFNGSAEENKTKGYREIGNFKSFSNNQKQYSCRQKINNDLSREKNKNTLILGPSLMDIRDGIYNYCTDILDITPLVVRFGTGGQNCFADAYAPDLRSFMAEGVSGEVIAELDKTYNLLFMERLRDEWSHYSKELSRVFFISLLVAYGDAIKSQGAGGILILDNIGHCGPDELVLCREILSIAEDKVPVLASSPGPVSKSWQNLFSRVLRYSRDDFSVSGALPIDALIPHDIWELTYNIALLGRYFPVYLFPQLFEEEKLNRTLYSRAIEILSALGILIPEEPLPVIQAEKNLGERKEIVRSAVRKLVHSWVLSGKLRPCFNLLRILGDLGERAGDDLVLRSLRGDVLNGTWEGIDEAIKEKYFPSLVGEDNAPVLEYIFVTLRALVWGGSPEVQRVFQEPVPALNCYEGCQVQVHANLAAYYIGKGNSDSASSAVRRAMHLNRSLGERAIPAFRLFSLVNLSRQRMDDALEYISFAIDQAEKTDQIEELFLSCYFGSSINFLYGNLSKAERLALRAEHFASTLGQTRWSMRAKFIRGRIFFETGRYREALGIFESLGSSDAGDSMMARTVRAWIFRTRFFLGRFSPMENTVPLSGIDGGIFEIEAAYYAGDYEKAAILAEDFLSSPAAVKDDFLFTEQPDWRSGFSQCEYLLQPEKIPGTRLAWVYRVMAQCAIHPSREKKAEILGSMQRFMRDELMPDTDPLDAFCFHAWYCMLRDSKNPTDSKNPGGEIQADMNTMLSMASRRLRRRADRIDDKETRQAFLTLAHWNSNLYLAAREHKIL